MEESVYLTSTMSPRIPNRGNRKSGKFKGPSVLALKKHFRRSINLEKEFKANDSVIIVEDVAVGNNEEELIISDSEKDFPQKDFILLASIEKSMRKNEENRRSLLNKLTKSVQIEKTERNFIPRPLKFDNVQELEKSDKKKQIEKWLEDVHNKNNNISLFNEISTIFGEGMTNMGVANSTVIVPTENAIIESKKDSLNVESVSDSFIDIKHDKISSEYNKMDSTPNANETEEKEISPEHYDECIKVLDELYGIEWRKDQDKILPKPKSTTSKKKNEEAQINKQENEQTSPYFKNKSKPDSLIKTLQKERLKLNLDNLKPREFKGIKLNFETSPNTPAKINLDDNKSNKKSKSKSNSDKSSPLRNKTPLSKINSTKSESDSDDINSNLRNTRKCRKIKKFLVDSDSDEDSEKENQNLRINDHKKRKQKSKNNNIDDDDWFIKENLENRLKNLTIDNKKDDEAKKSDNDWQSVDESNSKNSSEESGVEKIVNRKKNIEKTQDNKHSFLASLSNCIPLDECDFSARIYRTNFKKHKDDLAHYLFKLFNEKVFDNQIPVDTQLTWNDKLIKTSGLCKCRKIRHKDGTVDHKAVIQLSTKVLNSADRLRDTLIHEMCHAATWTINKVNDGHGPYWKNWTIKAMKTFKDLPPIKRCHDYDIDTKYTYRCIKCGHSFGRHSKSLDLQRKRCGMDNDGLGPCMGQFEVLLNKIDKNGERKQVTATPRKQTTPFAQFVKDNYKNYKSPALKHGDVMKLLGKKFAEVKLENK